MTTAQDRAAAERALWSDTRGNQLGQSWDVDLGDPAAVIDIDTLVVQLRRGPNERATLVASYPPVADPDVVDISIGDTVFDDPDPLFEWIITATDGLNIEAGDLWVHATVEIDGIPDTLQPVHKFVLNERVAVTP